MLGALVLMYVGGLAVSMLAPILVTWPTMLVLGWVSSFLPIVPPLGFWQTFAVLVLLRFLFPMPTQLKVEDK